MMAYYKNSSQYWVALRFIQLITTHPWNFTKWLGRNTTISVAFYVCLLLSYSILICNPKKRKAKSTNGDVTCKSSMSVLRNFSCFSHNWVNLLEKISVTSIFQKRIALFFEVFIAIIFTKTSYTNFFQQACSIVRATTKSYFSVLKQIEVGKSSKTCSSLRSGAFWKKFKFSTYH